MCGQGGRHRPSLLVGPRALQVGPGRSSRARLPVLQQVGCSCAWSRGQGIRLKKVESEGVVVIVGG